VVRDILPPGLRLLDARSSRGQVEVNGGAAVTATTVVSGSGEMPPSWTPAAKLYTSPAVTATAVVSGSSEIPPPAEVIFRVGELPPGGRALMQIRTLAPAGAAAGTRYENRATFAAANMAPGRSNRVTVTVEGAPRFFLPVTGGLLELVDPRTPQGGIFWLLFGLGGGLALWLRRRGRQ